jgi:hypothetical protein
MMPGLGTEADLGSVANAGALHGGPAAPLVPHFPRFCALALFGRRPHERVDGLVIAGVRKPAQILILCL